MFRGHACSLNMKTTRSPTPPPPTPLAQLHNVITASYFTLPYRGLPRKCVEVTLYNHKPNNVLELNNTEVKPRTSSTSLCECQSPYYQITCKDAWPCWITFFYIYWKFREKGTIHINEQGCECWDSVKFTDIYPRHTPSYIIPLYKCRSACF